MSEFDEEFVRQWIKALRSGDYKQGQGFLKNCDSFCCLGVACDLDENIKWENGRAVSGSDSQNMLLPRKVGKKLGAQKITGFRTPLIKREVVIKHVLGKVSEHILDLHDNGSGIYLTTLNDNTGISFDKIADILEEHYFGGQNG